MRIPTLQDFATTPEAERLLELREAGREELRQWRQRRKTQRRERRAARKRGNAEVTR